MRLTFTENDAFLFSGFKKHNFQLPPFFSHVTTFNLVPVMTGSVLLPPVRLVCADTNQDLLQHGAQRSIFIAPSKLAAHPRELLGGGETARPAIPCPEVGAAPPSPTLPTHPEPVTAS